MSEWPLVWSVGLAVLIAWAIVLVLVAIASLAARIVARSRPGVHAALAPTRRRLRVLLGLVATWIAVAVTAPDERWFPVVSHVFLIVTMAAGGWLLSALLNLAIDRTLVRYPIDVPDNRVARRIRTQVLIIRRLGHVAIAIVGLGAILMTFPGAQAAGASILASAGLVSVVAGLAAQSTLANVFAGVQLAFSDAIRVDDVVIAEGEWGRIEEITLTYVVVSIWDQRRLVLPSTYFTTTPFQNWTRRGSELLGAVELDLDWTVSPSALRTELDRILAATELWDGRTANLQVTDAVGGLVRVRVLVSAHDAGQLWDLRCLVREELVEWLAQHSGLPRQRVLLVEPEGQQHRRRAPRGSSDGLFSGSPEADERGQQFTGAVPVQPARE